MGSGNNLRTPEELKAAYAIAVDLMKAAKENGVEHIAIGDIRISFKRTLQAFPLPQELQQAPAVQDDEELLYYSADA